MSASSDATRPDGVIANIPNGPGAAAILAAGIGSATLGILALAGDASPAINSMLQFYRPAGALSGVTTVTILVWILAWIVLYFLWRKKTAPLAAVNVASLALLAVGFLLTFPPVMDLLQGK